ncbi:unnamed protein product [Cuscuta campestris]|uniref:F-box domain-containing protein n=1 Tax=Cuscuta campestris TaxID=132261 RepID=A0A484LUR1_9ASTE|nr:unnamed protein product [Cuscuta campestris]
MAMNCGGESLCSGIEIESRGFMEDCPDRNLDCLGKSWGFDCGKGKLTDDVADLLPRDPFGMDINTTMTELSGITGWIENIDDQLFSGHLFLDCNMEGIMDISYEIENYWICKAESSKNQGSSAAVFDGEGGDPPDGMFLALSYLGVEDLLSVEQVCKSLRDAVQNDPLIWRSIKIDHPLSDRITDGALLQLTNRSQGQLSCLSLVECLKITDGGLKNVLERSKRLTKLCVAGCMKLSINGLLSSLKVFKNTGYPGIKRLRIGGLFGVTNEHYEELKLLLGVMDDTCQLSTATRKPRFYRGGQLYLSVDDDRAIDIEMCPKCQQLRLVYDCPSESCQGAPLQGGAQLCRACTLCISRCKSCGCCLSNCDYEETFCLENLCSDCIKKFFPNHPFLRPAGIFFICG